MAMGDRFTVNGIEYVEVYGRSCKKCTFNLRNGYGCGAIEVSCGDHESTEGTIFVEVEVSNKQ